VNFNCRGAGCRAVFDATNNNWAIEGFKITTTNNLNGMCFEINPGSVGLSTLLHHFAAINNICYSAGQSYDGNDNGNGSGSATPGADYMAAVGNLMQAAASLNAFGVCISAIDGNVTVSDGEGIMLDTWNAHLFTGIGVVANNMIWHSMRSCLQWTFGNFSGDNNLHVTWHNNTCCDLTNIGNDSGGGEIDFSSNNGTSSVHLTYANNITLTDRATSGNVSGPVYAAVWGGATWTNLINGTTDTENILKGQATSCNGTCDAGNNVSAFNSNGLGTNFYENPNFTDTTDLINNWVTFTPTCTGFRNTTACMGWNAETRTLTSLKPIYDLTPTSAHSPGKGYQRPSIACNTNPEYPTWLKGIVYLHYDGTHIWQYRDLVTVPCGM